MNMNLGMSRGLTSPPGNPPLFVGAIQNVQVQPKLTVFATNERCSGISPRSILASTYRLYGSAIAFTTILIGTIANRMASFLTLTGTSLLSWKSNLDIPFAPGSKLGLYMSLWFEEFSDRVGDTQPVKSPPTTTQTSSSLNLYVASPAYHHWNPNSSGSTSYGSVN